MALRLPWQRLGYNDTVTTPRNREPMNYNLSINYLSMINEYIKYKEVLDDCNRAVLNTAV